MNNLFQIANMYYDSFESYKQVITFKSLISWISLFAILCFMYSFFWYLDNSMWPNILPNQNHRLLVVMLFEVIIITCWFWLQRKRDYFVIKHMQKVLCTKECSIIKLKGMWLKFKLGIPQKEYIKVADDIDKFLFLREKYKSKLSINIKQVVALIFHDDSKNRLLAMFMGISALVVILCVSGGASIKSVFLFFDNYSFTYLLVTDILFSLFIMMGFLVFHYILTVVFMLFELFIDKIDGINAISSRRVKVFITQLLLFYELPKRHPKKHLTKSSRGTRYRTPLN